MDSAAGASFLGVGQGKGKSPLGGSSGDDDDGGGGGGGGGGGDGSSSYKLPLAALECGVCLSLLCQPISLSCGHSFCRICLVNTLRRDKKRCPTCRVVCHNRAEDQPEDVMLAQLARTCFPELAERRNREAQAELNAFMAALPIFYYNMPMFPGEILQLHLFEPRYKLMMQRIVNTSRRFAYVPNYSNYVASVGDVALIAHLTECEFLSDGRVLLVAKLSSRQTIIDQFVEEGTQGLHYCRLQARVDEPPPPAGTHASIALFELHARTRQLAQRVIEPVTAEVIERYGESPESAEDFSLWISTIIPMPVRERHALLSGQSTADRLLACERHLASMAGNLHPSPPAMRDVAAVAENYVRQIAEGEETEQTLIAQAAAGPNNAEGDREDDSSSSSGSSSRRRGFPG